MISVSWEQVNAWRLSQHYLLKRASRAHLLDVVSRLGGVHAQMMSAAELQLWARTENLLPTEVRNALWHDRSLVKTWAMRGTLHLLASSEFPLYIGAFRTFRHFRRGSWLSYHGVTLAQVESIIENVRTILGSTPITREQLADAIASATNTPKLSKLLRSGWGALLKPVAFQGYLAFGPNQGQNVTFVQPACWLEEWTPADPPQACKEIVRRFLTAYGPATIDEFARWFGMEPGDAKRHFRALGDEIEEVNVEGWKGWMLASALKTTPPSVQAVNLLPNFDPYVIAIARHCEYVMPKAHKARIYRPQGWISPVVLVNGRMEGVWEYDKQRSWVAVKVEMFSPPSGEIRQCIETEAQRLGRFLNAGAQVNFA
jgi:hypothetical protein